MKFPKSTFPALLVTGFLSLATACEAGGAKKAGGVGNFVQPLPDDTVIVEYNGGNVKAKDVQASVEGEIKKMNEELLDNYKRAAENAVIRKLLDEEAKKQGLPNAEALVEKTAATSSVTDEQIKAFIKENKEQIEKDPKTGKKIKVDQKVLEQQVRQHLENQDKQGRVQALVGGIRANAKVKMKLEEPRTVIKDEPNAPFLGGASAKVVIHEFSDFECPFCSRGKASVDQIKQAYGDKVKIVFRHFPLSFHANAKPAAVASICAQKQGKFWEMHDKMFENQQSLTEDSFTKWASELSLDGTAFGNCLKDPASAKIVDADMKAAEEVGVNSTPTFFINGKKVAGALPFEQFKQIIDEELAKN